MPLATVCALGYSVAMSLAGSEMTGSKPDSPFGASLAPIVLPPIFYCISMWCAHFGFEPFVPADVMEIWEIIQFTWIIIWAIHIFVCVKFAENIEQRSRWFSENSLWVEISTLIGIQAIVWMFVPYGNGETTLLAIDGLMAYVIIVMLLNPEGIKINIISSVSVLLPLMLIAFINNQTYWIIINIFMFVFIIVSCILNIKYADSSMKFRKTRALVEQQLVARTRFLASASHDLGQPLQAARLFFDQAKRGANEEQRAAAFRNADNALSAMDRQLRYMLDHVRLTSQALEARPRNTRLSSILINVFTQFEPVAEMSQVDMRLIASSKSAWLDASLLERALGNLIDNALRHADASRLLIGVCGNRIWVIDNGRGIAADELSHLFEEFRQGESSPTRERGGFGLGLASTRRLIELNGGTVGLDARWLGGSAFFLELPRVANVTPAPKGDEGGVLPDMR